MRAPNQAPRLFSTTFQISGRRESSGTRYCAVSAQTLMTVPMMPHTQTGTRLQAMPKSRVSGMKAATFVTTSPSWVGSDWEALAARRRRSMPMLYLNVPMARGLGISTAVAIAAA
ncbi:hypothetical protein A8L58_14190 [Acidipropionibacterium acidipropionici]|uniref:Uncharacterized protein n=1 Tax=Acidipropionibacterium acidipropionici TaxID=1748 RepID=A0A1D9L8S8_9ACTN|nr:hypothetical protein A8L58_14190 [Acidipropionibacterium acidipropionici]